MTRYNISSPDRSSQIIIDCKFRTPASDALTARITEALGGQTNAVIRLFAAIMTHTRAIDFVYNGGLPPSEIVASMELFWVWLQNNLYKLEGEPGHTSICGITDDPQIIRESFERFNEYVFETLQEQWAAAYLNAQILFPAADALKPDESLPAGLINDPGFLANGKPG